MSKKYLALVFVPAFALGLAACEQGGQDQSAQQPPGSEQQAMGETGSMSESGSMGSQDTMGSQSAGTEQATPPSSMDQPDQQATQPSTPPQG